MLAALNDDPGRPSGVPDVQQRLGPFATGALPASRLVTGPRESVEQRVVGGRRGPVVVRTCQFVVEHYAAGGDDNLEPLLAWATKALVANRLGGLALYVDELEVQWADAASDQDYRRVAQVFGVQYATLVADQEEALPTAP